MLGQRHARIERIASHGLEGKTQPLMGPIRASVSITRPNRWRPSGITKLNTSPARTDFCDGSTIRMFVGGGSGTTAHHRGFDRCRSRLDAIVSRLGGGRIKQCELFCVRPLDELH